MEINYSAFRLRRGLPPSKFEFNDFAQTKAHNSIQNVLCNNISNGNFGVLSSQLSAMTIACNQCCTSKSTKTDLQNLQHLRHSVLRERILALNIRERNRNSLWCKKPNTIEDISSAILCSSTSDANSSIISRKIVRIF